MPETSLVVAAPDIKPDLKYDRPTEPIATLILAHGAGAPMDSPFMDKMVALLNARNIAVCRFEFPYMAARRTTGRKSPAPKAETQVSVYHAAVAAVAPSGPLFIGGKSMGGRIASMILDDLHATGRVKGGVCLGYPFHPQGKPDNVRTVHLEHLAAPCLIVQGDRDPLGNRAEVAAYALSDAIELVWLPDGDHDFGPRGASGHTRTQNLTQAADAVATFIDQNLTRT